MIPLIIQDQFDTIQNLQRSPIPQTYQKRCCCFLQQTGSSKTNKMQMETFFDLESRNSLTVM